MLPGREELAAPGAPLKSRSFATTRWSVVLATRDAEPDRARQALEQLCATYWYPVHACVRRYGKEHAEAEDITQGFFERLLSHQTFQQLEPAKTRLRSFLWIALRNCLLDIQHHQHRRKRAGNTHPLSLDTMSARQRYQCDPVERWTPDQLFERRWALALIDAALARLKTETTAARRGHLFSELEGYMLGEKDGQTYAELAQRLGMSPGSLRVTVMRLRRRFAQLCSEEVAHTVDDPNEIQDELNHLLRVLAQ